jgi:hypothetical protein
VRLDVYASFSAGSAVTKTAPRPVLETLTQAALHRIAMNLAKLFHEVRVISNIDIVVPLLPEMLGTAD